MAGGDSVVLYNVETGEKYLAKVNSLIINVNSTDMTKVYLEYGAMVEMTEYHSLYTDEGFKSITNHKEYETLEEDNVKTSYEYSKIKRYKIEPIMTYNLKIRDFFWEPTYPGP